MEAKISYQQHIAQLKWVAVSIIDYLSELCETANYKAAWSPAKLPKHLDWDINSNPHTP